MKHFSIRCYRTRHTAPRLALKAFTLLGALLLAVPAGAGCQINSVNGVDFGVYDVFANAPNRNGVGSLAIKCTGGSSAIVKLSTGQSTSFAPRNLRSGANTLAYNLYINATRNIVWGDGTGGTSIMSAKKNDAATLDIFGNIPAGQDAAVGVYNDTIIMTIEF